MYSAFMHLCKQARAQNYCKDTTPQYNCTHLLVVVYIYYVVCMYSSLLQRCIKALYGMSCSCFVSLQGVLWRSR